MSSDSPVRLSRDGVTLTGYLVLALWGWFLYGFGSLLAQLGRDQGISATVTSLHSVLLAAGALIAGFGFVPLVRRVRRRGVLRLAATMVLTGSVMFVAGGAWTAVTLPAILFIGTGGSLLVNAVNPLLNEHHAPRGEGHSAAALAEGNAVAAACGLVAPLAVGAGVALGLSWRPAILVTVPLALATLWMVARQPAGVLALDDDSTGAPGARRPMPVGFWPVLGMMMGLIGVEFCMTAWSAELLRTRTDLSSGAAAAGVSAVIGGMMLGRVLLGRMALRRPAKPLLVVAILVCLAGWAVTWTTTVATVALLGLLITGLGMAAHYPLGASLGMAAAGDQRDRASGLLSLGIGVAAGGGPFAIGALSDATSTHAAFLVVPVLLVLGLGLLLLTGPVTSRRPR
ncbi:MFS transporter [Spongisporangium articulatum]|uniref:MFS transporter n=1 Tax=Spongisporangium articulatum TaxID=3362603 RepID=A0ABW8AGX3_9ACTN